MGWDSFILYALAALVCWVAGAYISTRSDKRGLAAGVTGLGSAVFLCFILGLWMTLERPPMRTMGETRLWYSFFLSLTGLGVYCKWGYKWILSFSTMMSIVFICVNIFKPEIHSKALMPALQSPWFVPHVIVYMFAYAMMGVATLFALYLWLRPSKKIATDEEMSVCDSLVKIGWGFLTLGMTMGALWAKETWGDYWTWDPKETWALATWLCYLLYIHLRPRMKDRDLSFALLLFAFILLQMCWWGINYLPTVASVHKY